MTDAGRLEMPLDSRIEEIGRLAEAVESFCDGHDLPPKAAFQFNLCFDELLTNVILHGLRGEAGHPIQVALTLSDGRLEAEIVDDGPAFDPLARPPADVAAGLDEREIGGLGIHLVRSMMDRTAYRRVDERNHFTFSQPLATGGGATAGIG